MKKGKYWYQSRAKGNREREKKVIVLNFTILTNPDGTITVVKEEASE